MNRRLARTALTAIAKFCQDDQWRFLALEALDAPDDDELEPGPDNRRPMTNAERQRRKREKAKREADRHGERVDPTRGDTPTDTERHGSVSGRVAPRVADRARDLDLDPSLPQSFQDLRGSRSLETREPGDTKRHDARHGERVDPTREETPPAPASRPAVSAADDGCFGFAVSAWREGVREATGRPITLSLGVVRHLVDVIVDNCPALAEREAWAHTKAASWARACKAAGVVLNPHKFADWIASDERLSQPRSMQTPAGESPEARAQRLDEAQRQRDERDRAYAAEGARPPKPGELTAALDRPGVRTARRRTA